MALPTIYLEGNLVADPELRFTNQGTAVGNFRVACNNRRKNQQTGQWEDGDTTFLRISVFKGLAENVSNQLSKGSKVSVTGRLKQSNWEKDGQKRSSYEVTADSVSVQVPKFSDDNSGGQKSFEPQGPQAGPFADDNPPF